MGTWDTLAEPLVKLQLGEQGKEVNLLVVKLQLGEQGKEVNFSGGYRGLSLYATSRMITHRC